MSEMIEKVARAIYGARYGVEPVDFDDDGVPPAVKKDFRDQARAAIEAMRDGVTNEMAEAGDDGYYGMDGTDVWQAMIDVALRQEPGS